MHMMQEYPGCMPGFRVKPHCAAESLSLAAVLVLLDRKKLRTYRRHTPYAHSRLVTQSGTPGDVTAIHSSAAHLDKPSWVFD